MRHFYEKKKNFRLFWCQMRKFHSVRILCHKENSFLSRYRSQSLTFTPNRVKKFSLYIISFCIMFPHSSLKTIQRFISQDRSSEVKAPIPEYLNLDIITHLFCSENLKIAKSRYSYIFKDRQDYSSLLPFLFVLSGTKIHVRR